MMQIDTSAAAFLAGIVTSVHCVGMCGPLSCSWAISAKDGGFMRSTALYHGGRLLAYGLVGALAGTIGMMPLSFFQHGAGIVLPWLLVLAFAMAGGYARDIRDTVDIHAATLLTARRLLG